MYCTICLFPWLPQNYDFRAAVMKVFNISAEELVRLQILSACNILMFSVASEEVFIRVSELHYRTLYFPVLGLNVLQCYAYPDCPQFLFFKMSPFQGKDMTHTMSELGLVLYKRLISKKGPFVPGSGKDTIGVVLLMKDRSYKGAVCVAGQWQGGVGPAPQYEPAAGANSAAAGLLQPFGVPAYSLHSGCPYQYQGQQINNGQTPIDKGPSGNPSVEDQNPKPSDEDKHE